ncbi:MAG: hypothetical protein FJW26_07270 [Acidimicrobiia bacterium]|nr:hypothetical protein [Acidimicrobiia bacterium]
MKMSATSAMLLALTLAADVGFSEDQPKPPNAKRVFTNDDLNKYGETYGREAVQVQPTTPATSAASKTALDAPKESGKPGVQAKSTADQERARWAGRLKDADKAVQKAKMDQAKYASALEKFEQKRREAQTDFQKTLTQNQAADSQKNLLRATEQVKQAEETKAKLLSEAAQKGFKPEDLQGAPESAQAQQ